MLALEGAGVPLLVGTDTPNPLLVPGYSMHEELSALVEAGLTPEAVLRSATVTPAHQLGFAGERGVIAVGSRADLVLVRCNPLLELDTLSQPLGTMVAGRWLDAAALNALLEEGRAAASPVTSPRRALSLRRLDRDEIALIPAEQGCVVECVGLDARAMSL